jgi:hypothetical protein
MRSLGGRSGSVLTFLRAAIEIVPSKGGRHMRIAYRMPPRA